MIRSGHWPGESQLHECLFCGETLPKRSQAEALLTIPCLLTAMTSWTCWSSYKIIQQALEERAKFWAKSNVWGCSAPRVRSLASKTLLQSGSASFGRPMALRHSAKLLTESNGVRMLRTESALLGFQSSPVERHLSACPCLGGKVPNCWLRAMC